MNKNALFTAVFALASLPAVAEELPLPEGPYEPTWESLRKYDCPEWFRDAKFGIWAHWGPQCVEESGDWNARSIYLEGTKQYKEHLKNYGHPSEYGFKDVLPDFKAEHWNPDSLVSFYKSVGARYFMALGNHHDNFDLWDSKFQPWNSVAIGPHRDLLAGWAAAAQKCGLPFGVSLHADHAWTWYEPSRRYDRSGDKVAANYDGWLTKEDGKGKWWEGYDPQELYVQHHSLSGHAWSAWDWPEGTSVPPQWYYDNFFNRTVDMINRYNPDLVYFDDSVLPFWPIDNTGLDVVAHFYNRNMKRHDGRLEAVVFGKKLNDDHKKALVWDVEKGVPGECQEKAWQTCTCLGNWHYDRSCYVDNWYKSAKTVIHMLVDIVSKNGNMLLSVPVKGDGSIDDKEEKILEDIAAWMDVNKEGVFDTRPWTVYGEGPSTENAAPLDGAGFNEGKNAPYTPADIRFVKKGDVLYAHVLAWPDDNKVLIKSLAAGSGLYPGKIKRVELLGAGKVSHRRTAEGLAVNLPRGKKPNDISFVLKITK